MREVNLHSYMKRRSKADRQGREGADYSRILAGLESGIWHLHSLGLVHNDINPRNIMLEAGEAIIIDFRSCRREGESLAGVGSTYEWHDENVPVSRFKNDLGALE